MKPSERSHETELDPEVERHLDAIDRALAGEAADPELAELAGLANDLREMRETPSPEWQAELDSRARSGFGGPSPLDRLRDLLPARPGRMLAPAGALATALVIVGVGISQVGEEEVSDGVVQSSDVPAQESTSLVPEGGGDAAVAEPSSAADGAIVGGASSADIDLGGEARTAPGKSKRQQDRSAFLALKADTDEVRDLSDRAIQITESAGGVVLSSQLTEGEMEATARLELSLPTRELDATLDQLTDLATVESLNEAAVDITKPFVSARDQLQDARAERRELLRALGNASSDEEAEAIRKQLRGARREISRAEASFDNIARRARTSNVRMEINGSPGGGDDGSWGLGEAADDALGALKTVAGVLLIAAAIIAPIAILIAVVALTTMAVRRRRRDRALDEG